MPCRVLQGTPEIHMSPIKAQVDNTKSKCADQQKCANNYRAKYLHLKTGEHIEESTLKDANHNKNVDNKSVNKEPTKVKNKIHIQFKKNFNGHRN